MSNFPREDVPTGYEYAVINKFGPPSVDVDYVKWEDVTPDEDSAMAAILDGLEFGADTDVSADSKNDETGESNE